MQTVATLFTNIVLEMGIMASKVSLPVLRNGDFPDLMLRSNLFGADSPFLEDLDYEAPDDGTKKVLLISDDFNCNYILGRFDDDGSYRMVGPFLYGGVDPVEVRRNLMRRGLGNVDLTYLSRYYHDLPVIRDENLMYAIIHTHCVSRFGEGGFELVNLRLNLKDLSGDRAPVKQYSGYQMEIRSEIYARESLLMAAIAEGNYDRAQASMRRLRTHDPELRSMSTLRDMKNYSIVFNTICRLAAHQGGAHAYDIDRVSGEFSRSIENLSNVYDLMPLRETMIRSYCDLVNRARVNGYSVSIGQVTDFINSHYDEDLTLSSAAERFNMSLGHLSSRFHKETGMTFSEYLTRRRLEHAKLILRSTEMTIAMVAEDCGIPDNNYFSRLFRKYEGMTPLEYRRGKKG